MELTFIGILVVLFAFIWIRHILKRQRSPPGPLGIPFLGIIVQQRNSQSLQSMIDGMDKKYGELFSFELGMQNFVVFNSYKMIKEALIEKSDIFSTRPTTPFYMKINANKGIAMNNGAIWKENRRFTLRVLRNFGFGKSILQEKIIEEVEFVESLILKSLDSPLTTTDMFVLGVSNVISLLVFGKRWGYNDPEFKQHIEDIKSVTQNEDFLIFLPMFYPFLAKDWIINRIPGCKQSFQSHYRLLEVIKKNMEEHRSKYDVNDEPRDVIEAYIQEQHKYTEEGNETMLKIFRDEQYVSVFYDLFLAGTDTTTNSLAWAMLNMALNKEIQDKVHQELDRVIGQDRRPQISDRKSLHFCQAVLDEVTRFCTVVPLSVEKSPTHDTELQGHFISKTDIIFTNIYGVHRDPQFWERPHEFYPKHFLNESGEYKPSEYLIPFGIGKRSCLGESLAQMEYFLFFACLMQRFTVKYCGDPNDTKTIKAVFQGTNGVIRAPNPHHLKFEKRGLKCEE